MRNGKLLSEGSPATLMAKYNCNNVEDVFLLLSRKQQEGHLNSGPQLDIELEEISLTDDTQKLDDAKETFVSITIQDLCENNLWFLARR